MGRDGKCTIEQERGEQKRKEDFAPLESVFHLEQVRKQNHDQDRSDDSGIDEPGGAKQKPHLRYALGLDQHEGRTKKEHCLPLCS